MSSRKMSTRSKSRDEGDQQQEPQERAASPQTTTRKENVGNESDFRPPSPMSTSNTRSSSLTPRKGSSQKQKSGTSTGRTNRSAASLFSPTPYSSSRSRTSPPSAAASFAEQSMARMRKPDPFPDDWEKAMGTGRGSRRGGTESQASQEPFGGGYSQQTDSRGDDRKTMLWEPREASSDTNNNSYGSPSDLEMVTRDGVDDFPAVADCLNLGSFAEESPPRNRKSSPQKASPTSQYNTSDPNQPYPYRSSPYRRGYPPHASPPAQYSTGSSGPPPPPHGPPYPGSAGAGGPMHPPPMYYPPQGPSAGSPFGYPPPPPYRYPHYHHQHQQPYQPDAWMSPPARFPDYPPSSQERGTPPRGSPPPKKRRSNEWDNSGGTSSSSPQQQQAQDDDAVGSTTPEKVEQVEPSPFRSPIPQEKGSSKKYKRSPLFQGVGTPGIAAYGSWDTPGGTLNAALADEFSPMGPSFAPFDEHDEALTAEATPMPFDAKLDLAASSGEEPAAPPAIRQRQPVASPFSAFVGELSPFPPAMRGSPPMGSIDPRDNYGTRHHPGHQAFHRSPPDDFPRHPPHPGMPTPSKRSGPPPPPPNRPSHPMASPVMAGSAQRHQPWYEHVGPSPGAPFRLELGDGKNRKGFEDINSLLRGANGPPPPHPTRPSPPSAGRPPPPRYDGSSSAGGLRSTPSARELSTPIKSDGRPPSSLGGVGPPGSEGRPGSFHGSARKTPMGSAANTPRYTPMSKGRASTPGSKTPSSASRKVGPQSLEKKSRRHPCNCKKSKCLKLYCECFAGELYCDGCNCNDCHNTTAYESERQKSMKDTRAKNPNAFKARITVKSTPGGSGTTTPAGGHNMGCRCKKSECLKKYCECFQAGVMCAGKCKCVDCLNYVGSQALIDKRRKMKDHRGAEMAMRIADEAWKGGKPHSAPRGMNPRGLKPSPAVSQRGPPMPMPHMMQPSPSPRHRGPPPPPPPHYMGPMAMGPPRMGYSPMGMPPMTPGYGRGSAKKPSPPSSTRRMEAMRAEPPKADPKKQQQQPPQHPGRIPKTVTPRTPAVRLGFDPHSSKKKRKLSLGEKEPTFPYFGDRPEQPKTTALAIFSYLSNDDLFNSTLVCKQWNKLAMDDELWQF